MNIMKRKHENPKHNMAINLPFLLLHCSMKKAVTSFPLPSVELRWPIWCYCNGYWWYARTKLLMCNYEDGYAGVCHIDFIFCVCKQICSLRMRKRKYISGLLAVRILSKAQAKRLLALDWTSNRWQYNFIHLFYLSIYNVDKLGYLLIVLLTFSSTTWFHILNPQLLRKENISPRTSFQKYSLHIKQMIQIWVDTDKLCKRDILML